MFQKKHSIAMIEMECEFCEAIITVPCLECFKNGNLIKLFILRPVKCPCCEEINRFEKYKKIQSV